MPTEEDEITERLTLDNGEKWIRVWRVIFPGMMQLVWERVKP